MWVLAHVAWHISLLPLAWCVVLRASGRPVDKAYWLLGAAMSISWLADLPALWFNTWVPSLAYPVSQSALVAAVIYPRRKDAVAYTLLVMLVGALVIAQQGARGPDVILRAVAWLPLCYAVYDQPALDSLRTAVLVYFGLGFVMWLAHVGYIKTHPDLHGAAPTWFTFHAARLIGLILLCRAATETQPTLRILRPA